MDEVRHKKVILETIDQLRGRKARPDFKGICHMLERKHQLNVEEITRDLDRLCEQQLVIKVDYKGSISYRNAAKWRRSHEVAGDPEADAGGGLLRAVKELTQEAGSTGCSLNEVDEWLKRNPAHVNLTLQELKAALENECGAGNLKKNASGNYYRGERKRQRSRTASAAAAATPAPADDEGAKRSRSVAKRKRFKRGADSESTDGTPGVTQHDAAGPRCDYCLQTSEANKTGDWEELLICKDCPAKAHPSCMSYSAQLSRRAQMSPWQCIDCKTCCMCQNADEPDAMLFCDACDKGYHMYCHKPAVLAKPTGKWACRRCQADGLEPGGQSGAASPFPPDTTSAERDSSSVSSMDSEESSKSPAKADESFACAGSAESAVASAMETDTSVVDVTADKKELKPDLAVPSTLLLSTQSALMSTLSQKEALALMSHPSANGYLPTSLHSPSIAQQLSSPGRAVAAVRTPHVLQQAPALPQLVASAVHKQAPAMLQLASIVQNRDLPVRKQALTEQKQAPVHAPPLQKQAPPAQKQAPAEQKQVPPEQKQAPSMHKQVPAEQKQAPPVHKQAPAEQKQAPPVHKQAPAEQKQVPAVQKQAPPVQKQVPHVPKQASPVHRQAPPEQKQVPPVQKQAHPAQKQALPVQIKQIQAIQQQASPLAQQQVPNVSQHQAPAVQKQTTPMQNQVPPVQKHAPPLQQQILSVAQKQTPVEARKEVPASCRYISTPPSEWTVEDVVQYFRNSGFPQESERFMEQEIDGKSLLLLMRNDVLANMALTLGPALKIYERVKMIQACGSTRCLPPQARQ